MIILPRSGSRPFTPGQASASPTLCKRLRRWWLVLQLVLAALSWLMLLWPGSVLATSLPAGFTETFQGYWNNAVGLVFDENGTMYQWDRDGRVWILVDDVRLPTPLIDLREEVGSWQDHGLLGFALHPNFLQNGYLYLMYAVDHHHLTKFGTAQYNPAANEYDRATIGRITRYTARASDGFRSVDPASRTVLLGESISNGIPIVSGIHGVGTLVFGDDGTLLVSCGDGAYTSDAGNSPLSYFSQALSEGIISPKENIGAFRSQIVDSLSGKILRLDPNTGDGVPSNPFYDPAKPRAARSRVWALGLRNPFRIALRPETGAHIPSEAKPGVIILGDVGEYVWEEMNVVTRPGMNFGWPIYEGLTVSPTFGTEDFPNPDAPNPLYGIAGCARQYFTYRELFKEATLGTPSWPNPCDASQQVPPSIPHFLHSRPAIDWQHGSGPARTGIFNGNNAGIINLGAPGSPVAGPQFGGNCAIGGTWYLGDSFPAQYKNTYFIADLGVGWIRNVVFDTNNNPVSIGNFASGTGGPVALAAHPFTGALYYLSVDTGIYKITYGGNAPPRALAASDVTYGPGPLTVHFTGSGSTDPEGSPLTYRWNFGDGSPVSTLANPTHLFSADSGLPTRFDVTLTVTDSGSASNTDHLVISVNNTPPVVAIASPAADTFYSVTAQTTINLIPLVTDTEHSGAQLHAEWRSDLHHNNHVHPGQPNTNWSTTAVLAPAGCDGQVYFYRVQLTVTDDAGLSDTAFVDVYPACSNTPPAISHIADQTLNINATFGPVPVTISDLQTFPSQLTLAGSSSDRALVRDANIVFGGAGTDRTVTVTPEPGATGTTTITLTVSDGLLTAEDRFLLTFAAPNRPPTIDPLGDVVLSEDGPLHIMNLSGISTGDPAEFDALSITALSSNPGLIPDPIVSYTSPGATGTLKLQPAANANGIAVVTVTVDDGNPNNGKTATSFTVTVNPVNDPPTISVIPAQNMGQNTTSTAIPFVVGDLETPAAELTLTGSSSNPSLILSSGIMFGGEGADRTVTLAPLASRVGTATITVTVSDGQLASEGTFVLTVSASVGSPSITAIENLRTAEGTPDGTLLTIEGLSNVEYWIDASADLETWIPLGSVSDPTGGSLFIDSESTNMNHRFYRVFATP